MADDQTGCNLKIDFSGLAVFTTHQNKTVVLLPDARYDPDRADGWGMRHLDGTPAEAHVGYLSFDLAYLDSGAVGEVVVKLDRHSISFDSLADVPTDATRLDLPDFDDFAPVWKLNTDLLGSKPSKMLLARLHLLGGEFDGGSDGMERMVTRVLASKTSPGYQPSSKTFMNRVSWTRNVPDSTSVVVTLTPLDTGAVRKFTLHSVGGNLRLRLGNLCAVNPLEWNELTPTPSEATKPLEDLDFKWLSILFETKRAEIPPVFDASHAVPYLRRMPDERQGLIYNCFPARATFAS